MSEMHILDIFSSYFYNDLLFVINTTLLSSFLFVIYGFSGYGTDRILKLIINYRNGSTTHDGNSNHTKEKDDDFNFFVHFDELYK
jgi:hypothetical protein